IISTPVESGCRCSVKVMQSEEYEAKYDTKESSVCFNFCLNSAPSQFISVQGVFWR
ncbi:hypothetical protein Anas_02697, partial [Armadillidium nasatum]